MDAPMLAGSRIGGPGGFDVRISSPDNDTKRRLCQDYNRRYISSGAVRSCSPADLAPHFEEGATNA